MERRPCWQPELFNGNWKLFMEVFGNPKTNIMYDADGIVVNSLKKVHENFTKKTGIEAHPKDIDEWHYLTNLARASGLLDEEDIQRSEDDYYNPDVLLNSQPHLYIRPIIHRTSRIYGRASNFVLTSREPYLENATRKWFKI